MIEQDIQIDHQEHSPQRKENKLSEFLLILWGYLLLIEATLFGKDSELDNDYGQR